MRIIEIFINFCKKFKKMYIQYDILSFNEEIKSLKEFKIAIKEEIK
jgi:hypothetical protein